jgi:hypothetical protein
VNHWLDLFLVTLAVLASAAYAAYALGPRRLKNAYSRFATKYFGLRAARWFATDDACNNCSDKEHHKDARL